MVGSPHPSSSELPSCCKLTSSRRKTKAARENRGPSFTSSSSSSSSEASRWWSSSKKSAACVSTCTSKVCPGPCDRGSSTTTKGGEKMMKGSGRNSFVSEQPAGKVAQPAPWKRSERQEKGPRCCALTEAGQSAGLKRRHAGGVGRVASSLWSRTHHAVRDLDRHFLPARCRHVQSLARPDAVRALHLCGSRCIGHMHTLNE